MDYLVIANLFLLLFLGLADNQAIAALLPNLVKTFNVTVSLVALGASYWLYTRRDIPALRETLDAVSRHALSTGRKISLRLAREVLDGKG